ncbi:MAG: nucleotide exchange factor GrpE [Betaproteobacteria bacterium]|nr:nucleotide exchange factor GrpE [Betaproteobacteria bacterium]
MRDPPAADFDGLSDSRSGDFAESAPAAGDPGRADSPKDLDQELSRVRAQLQEAQSQLLRGLADMENLRKRTAIEVANAHKYAVESFAESLVPVLDSLELALKVDKPSVHLLAIEPVGERFDPNRHQAISMVPGTSVTPAVAANHVVTVLQKGYLIHERVLRPALVTVAQA